ncbi:MULTISPECIES: iron-sulfur cluster-binding domain-containing protein [Pseudomonas syringae group]|uniref:iron-sulfur cluster-binding domain-containing protein n=1 Tax=Pseudomonas syringae group TaxID=136849 RepID=UPI0006D64ACB|nr:iron-sulfur cluster-binding domain-containing protein [Pseudomonas coronafaciens]KPX32023.1 Ferredoxin [Pseudomonas coronafaciens pv. garcae]RMS97739.1 Ferredoxin [Pseudomonas coronafaciens pv. oryzae]
MHNRSFLRCENITQDTASVRTYALRVLAKEMVEQCDMGRYLILELPDHEGVIQQRNYSIVGRPEMDLVEISVKDTGRSGISSQLHSNVVVDSLLLSAGVGGAITIESLADAQSVAMFAGGIGITLPMALIRQLDKRAKQELRTPSVQLFVSVPSLVELPYLDELLAMSLSSAWLDVRIFLTQEKFVSDSRLFTSGRPLRADYKEMSVPDISVICGSKGFVSENRDVLNHLFPETKLLIENFTPVFDSASSFAGCDEASCNVTVYGTDQQHQVSRSATLLGELSRCNLEVKSQCKSGICGSCRVRLRSGSVRSDGDFALTPREKENGYILSCCSYPTSESICIEI